MLAPTRSAALFALALCAASFPVRSQASCAAQQNCGPLRLAISSASGSSIPKGLTKQLQATRFFFRGQGAAGNATGQVIWASSSRNATVSNTGLVKAQAQGPATITATSGILHASFQITITPPMLLAMAVSPGNANVPILGTKSFTATGRYSDGNTNAVPVNWASSNASVAP